MGLCSHVAAVVLLGKQLPFQPSTMKLVALLNDGSWQSVEWPQKFTLYPLSRFTAAEALWSSAVNAGASLQFPCLEDINSRSR